MAIHESIQTAAANEIYPTPPDKFKPKATMRGLVSLIAAFLLVGISSCRQSASHYNNVIDDAERVMATNTDSAMSMLDVIDPSDLRVDSLRAKYNYLRAYGHMRQNRSMVGDSLVASAYDYWRGKDVVRDMRSGTAYAWYKFWTGDTPGAITLLDSLVHHDNVPDSLMAQTLRSRVLLGAAEYQGEELVALAQNLLSIETEPKRKIEAKYVLLSAYEYAGKLDSALMLTNELVDFSRTNKLGEMGFQLMLERAQILTEMGRYSDSNADIDYIFHNAGPENGAADLLHIQRAINALNTNDAIKASRELAVADSFAVKFNKQDDPYYLSYSNLLHAMIDFKRDGKMKLAHVNGLNNRQRERYNRAKASQWESERSALEQQSRAHALKAESEHKTVIILIVVLVAVLLLAVSVWIIRHRRLRERENEERAEALQKMVNELKSSPAQTAAEAYTPVALRRAMLQQLGIIKMVAETPTEQNREMLRKISSMEGDSDGELVNWPDVFTLIDNLYSGFYTKLHEKYGDALSLKEEQITVLMVAGFSTKEISVITGQTTSTIYVRKSSIRKKLGVPEKEDIVAFLRNDTSH